MHINASCRDPGRLRSNRLRHNPSMKKARDLHPVEGSARSVRGAGRHAVAGPAVAGLGRPGLSALRTAALDSPRRGYGLAVVRGHARVAYGPVSVRSALADRQGPGAAGLRDRRHRRTGCLTPPAHAGDGGNPGTGTRRVYRRGCVHARPDSVLRAFAGVSADTKEVVLPVGGPALIMRNHIDAGDFRALAFFSIFPSLKAGSPQP